MALEKTVEMVQQAHVERQELIGQWENSIEQMRRKDQDLQQCALVFSSTKTLRSKTCANTSEQIIFTSIFSCWQRRTRRSANAKHSLKRSRTSCLTRWRTTRTARRRLLQSNARRTGYGNSFRKRRATAHDCKMRHVPVSAPTALPT